MNHGSKRTLGGAVTARAGRSMTRMAQAACTGTAGTDEAAGTDEPSGTDRLSRREQRRLQHQDLSRGQLLDAAEEVFGRKGFHEATLKEVAELAEFSVGSVYSFFTNKDDLFRQIFVRRGDEFMPGLRAVLRADGASPVDQLHALVDFQIGFFRQHPRFGRLFLRYSSATMSSADREIDAATAANYEESMALQAALFARGQAAGGVPARRPRGAGPAVLRADVGLPGARPGGDVRRDRRALPPGRPPRPGRAGVPRLSGPGYAEAR